MTDEPIDVDGILASLDPALADPGDNPWGSAFLEAGDGMRFLADELEHGGAPEDRIDVNRDLLVHLYRELQRLYPIAWRASQVPGWGDFHATRAANYILGEEQP